MKNKPCCISYQKIFLRLLCVSLFLTTSTILAKEPVPLYEPPRLFIVPVADTLKAFDINASGATTWETGQVSFRGTGFLGLGDIAQVELSSLRAFSTQHGDFEELSSTPAAGVKLALPLETYSRLLPNIAVSYHRSFGKEEENVFPRYQQQMADLYLVASKRFFSKGNGWRGFRLHVGADYFGARVETDERVETKGFWRPFGGVEIWASRYAKLMVEVEWFPRINVDGNPAIEEEPLWMTVAGVRVFITRFITADIGVRYQADFDTIADAKLEGKLGLAIPTHLLLGR
ncbi:hypothetical protein HYR99_26765 [Candidatus Poribacteria bacterium]|nr:hypothetical protein [Candidatus Poribacteria bacterium]